MNIVNKKDDKYILEASEEELIILRNCVAEICHAMYISEFQTRIGFTKEFVSNFAKNLSEELDKNDIEE
jgi:hypothetical protein